MEEYGPHEEYNQQDNFKPGSQSIGLLLFIASSIHLLCLEDYNSLFKENIDDCFRLGISLSKKTMKLYSDFYNSDLIIASPLALRMDIGASGYFKILHYYHNNLIVVIM